MNKTLMINKSAIVLGALLAGYSIGLQAETATGGAIELDADSMDAVSAAGSLLNPASPALQALADARGSLAMTGTSANTYVQDASTALWFGSAPNYISAQRGTASATSSGADASRSTQIVTAPDAFDPNPYGATISYTHSVLGTQISVFSQVRPAGFGIDFFDYRIRNLRR